jgi:transcriptional regulator with XRE-family HTH domain
MLEQLGRVALEARTAAELRQIDIATAASVSHAVISNLERGFRYPQRLDDVVAAYEKECGLEVGELWRRAVALL